MLTPGQSRVGTKPGTVEWETEVTQVDRALPLVVSSHLPDTVLPLVETHSGESLQSWTSAETVTRGMIRSTTHWAESHWLLAHLNQEMFLSWQSVTVVYVVTGKTWTGRDHQRKIRRPTTTHHLTLSFIKPIIAIVKKEFCLCQVVLWFIFLTSNFPPSISVFSYIELSMPLSI